MNVMGELVSLVGLAALAGIIIGWCIRNFFGGSEKRVRQHIAHDIDEAVKDAKHLRRALDSKDDELRETKTKLQQLRRKGGSSEIDTRIQVAEINELKQDLATTKKTLMDNQAEFSSYRTKSEKDQSELRKELSKYTAGGAASTERLTEANETIGALRSAVRENDKVIDSLRARVKEADGTVENLRTQLKSAESSRGQVETVSLEYDKKVEVLTKKVEDTNATVEKQKRDYDQMLETKNSDIKNLHGKLEEMTTSTSSMKTREHEFNKQAKQSKEAENKFKTEIVDLKRVISDRDQALSKARQQNTELKSQVKSVQQHEEREIQRLQAKIQDSTEVRSKIKSKSAEVSALNEMLTDSANKRDSLQKNVNELKSTLEEKDTDIQKLRLELDDVVASRNKVSTQLGELQSQGNAALEKLQQDLNNLANTRDEYKLRIDSLQSEVSELKDSKEQVTKLNTHNKEYKQRIDSLQTEVAELEDSKKQLNKLGEHSQAKYQAKAEKLKDESRIWQAEVKKLNTSNSEYKDHIAGLQSQISELTRSKENQLRDLRDQLNTTTQASDTKFKEATTELNNKNSMLQNDLKTLQAKLHDQTRSIEQHKADLAKQIDINQRTTATLSERENKLTEFRTKLNREESESQRLNRELSDAESLRLTLTERDAELRKAQIELQEASASGGPVQAQLDEQLRQNESLTKAIQDRDEELTRLNTQMTNNRLRSKQQQSSITLLTQEKEAQAELVRSLEQQAENTLQLHTKIAQQSTELEDLRARLYERDNNVSTTVGLTDNVNRTPSHTSNNGGLQQIETRPSAASKPRVFVRPDGDTEALTGATGYQSAQRTQFTLDGHRIRRPDGSDDLSLLPGVNQTIAGAFSRHGVTAFEQIVNWSDREVAHYAERVGVSVQRAQQYNWPKASVSILNGTYRKDGQEIGN